MIYESSFWKEDLVKQAKVLRSRMLQKRWYESSLARLEQTLMLGFYSIRKLVEAKKLSDIIAEKNIVLKFYKCKRNPITRLNWANIEALYNLDDEELINRNLIFVCNQFIHSYVFVPSFDGTDYLNGIFISSDRERSRGLYFIQILQVIDLFEEVGGNYPSSISLIFDEGLDDYRSISL